MHLRTKSLVMVYFYRAALCVMAYTNLTHTCHVPPSIFRIPKQLIFLSRTSFSKDIPKVQRIITASKSPANIGVMRRESNPGVKDCQMEKVSLWTN